MARTHTQPEDGERGERATAGEQTSVRNESASYPGSQLAREADEAADCPSAVAMEHIDDEVWDYLNGNCTATRLAVIDEHLDGCESCRTLVHHLLQGLRSSEQAPLRDLCECVLSFAPDSIINSRFAIRRFVGRGGMGEVYEALDRLTNTRVALKTILCSVEDRQRAARRLLGEVLHAQRVGHPHVCRINEMHEHDDLLTGQPIPFFTMEFVDGVRLSHRIRRDRLPVAQAGSIARQLLSGLAAAHSRGVLHLDFKSDNVMLRSGTDEPYAVIMDFGLSRLLESESRLHTSERHQVAGTLPYMSLEQLECREDLGPPADVYAFGVVLYELLTGALPFPGDSLRALLAAQLQTRPDAPSRRVPGLSPALDRFVLRCLNREPTARYADASEALSALQSIGDWSLPLQQRAYRRWVAFGALALALISCVIAARRFDAASLSTTTLRATARPSANISAPSPAGAGRPAPAGADTTRAESPPPAAPQRAATLTPARDGTARPRSTSGARATTPGQRRAAPSAVPPGLPASPAVPPGDEIAPTRDTPGAPPVPPGDTRWPEGVPHRLLSRPEPRERAPSERAPPTF